jgi:hypothetical protein
MEGEVFNTIGLDFEKSFDQNGVQYFIIYLKVTNHDSVYTISISISFSFYYIILVKFRSP